MYVSNVKNILKYTTVDYAISVMKIVYPQQPDNVFYAERAIISLWACVKLCRQIVSE